MIEDLTKYNSKDNNGYSYVEHQLIGTHETFADRIDRINYWADRLDEIGGQVSTEFTLTVRQIFSYSTNKISDIDFIRLFRIYTKGGNQCV